MVQHQVQSMLDWSATRRYVPLAMGAGVCGHRWVDQSPRTPHGVLFRRASLPECRPFLRSRFSMLMALGLRNAYPQGRKLVRHLIAESVDRHLSGVNESSRIAVT